MASAAKLTLLLLIVSTHLSILLVESQTCNRKTEKQMDKDLARLMVFGQKELKFPETARELRPFCNEAQRLSNKVKDYGQKCLNPFGKNALNILMHTAFTEMKSVCKAGRVSRTAQSLMEAAVCGNLGNENINKHCYTKMVDRLTQAIHVDSKLKIPICCCNFHEFLRCWEDQVEKISRCTAKSRDFFIKWVNRMFEGITQLMCVQYDESNAECDRFLTLTADKNSTKNNNIKYKSVFLPLVKISMSLDSEV